MKLFHPTIKLLQCAESKEETELKSYSCVRSAAFHMGAKDSDRVHRRGFCKFGNSTGHSTGCSCRGFSNLPCEVLNGIAYLGICLRVFLSHPIEGGGGVALAAVSCGLCPPSTFTSTDQKAMCLCYMALWRPSEGPWLGGDEGFTVR